MNIKSAMALTLMGFNIDEFKPGESFLLKDDKCMLIFKCTAAFYGTFNKDVAVYEVQAIPNNKKDVLNDAFWSLLYLEKNISFVDQIYDKVENIIICMRVKGLL